MASGEKTIFQPMSRPACELPRSKRLPGINIAGRFIQGTQQPLFVLVGQFRLALGIEPQLQSLPFIAWKPGNGILNFSQSVALRQIQE